ncbi:DUF2339 domain-containing protein [Martelella limonii]|uniref:DUF2339 domain-containing protein n=1 Tax=Martelella limonii TaxID=1647649 RepID=UPI001580BE17|nr:DUF2339 domain-containing protein [Martelella limonii]
MLDVVVVLLLIMLALSNSRLKVRLKRLEDEQKSSSDRLDRLEGQPDAGMLPAARKPQPESTAPALAGAPSAASAAPSAPVAEAVSAVPGEGEGAPNEPPRAFVFSATLLPRFWAWIRQNWTIALAALSLALGGVFMVQYGVENGLLTPFWRVAGALILGIALIAAGEVIRRRYGDDTEGATGSLPSVFAGAGLITLFSAVLAARHLYGLISPEATLAGLVVVSFLAVGLGWLYGAMLTAVGIIGATAAPLIVGGSSDNGWLIYYYFAFIAIAGLAVDSVKRWAWVSAIVLITTCSAASILYAAIDGPLHYIAFLAIAWAASIIVPVQSLVPHHGGQTTLATLMRIRPRADFPTRVAAAMTFFVSSAALFLTVEGLSAIDATVVFGFIAALLAASLVWMCRAEALKDIALLPAAAFLAVPVLQAADYGPLYAQILAINGAGSDVSTSAFFITLGVILATLASVLAFWRMTREHEDPKAAIGFALAAAVLAPAMAFIFQFLWSPELAVGTYRWSIHLLAVSLVMAFLTDRTMRGEDRASRQLRAGLFAIAALSMLALALFVVLTQTALTLALGVVVILTVWLDRRFDLALIGVFTKVALAIIAFRLVASPGFFWAVQSDTSWLSVIEAYAGTLALLYAGWHLSTHRARLALQLAIETTIWTIAAVFACAVIQRLVPEEPGLLAAVMAIAMLAQISRIRTSGAWMKRLRGALAVIFGLISAVLIAVPLTFSNPLASGSGPVSGPLLFDSIALSYLPLAMVLAVGAWKIGDPGRFLRIGFIGISSALFCFYVALEIRRFWRGPALSVPGVTQPELYTYTLALVIACAALLLVSFSRRSHVLRKVAMAMIALTIAKVFLIDISGLEGLLRVVSLIGLGLALAGLGWLERTMSLRWNRNGT